MKKQLFLIFFGISVFIFSACATAIVFQVEKPPALNTLGIQRIAVMPFAITDNNSALQRQASLWLTNESISRIQGTSHFTLVSSSEVDRLQNARGSVETIADALFSGQVVSTYVKDSSSQGTRKNKDGKNVSYTIYNREVQITYNYFITRTRDGSITGPVNKTFSTSSSSEKRAEVQSAESLLQNLVIRGMSGLGRDIAPYRTTERRSLMKETSSDKIIKQSAKEAESLAKSGSYKSAQKAFMDIYQESGSFAAGYNASLLIEVQGDLQGAAEFMQTVYNDTGNHNALSEINRLRSAMQTAGLLEAYKTNQNQRDKAVELVVEALPPVMPKNPRIAFINNSHNERELAESIVNSIMEKLLSKKITIVDRNNQALLEMERNYQYSGIVSDEEMVRIGNEAGVNAFVLVSVTGSGASRRLSVRMLDVERSVILYQSPQTDEMNL